MVVVFSGYICLYDPMEGRIIDHFLLALRHTQQERTLLHPKWPTFILLCSHTIAVKAAKAQGGKPRPP